MEAANHAPSHIPGHDFPEWDRVMPLDVYKHLRQVHMQRAIANLSPLLAKRGADGQPLYVMTESGNIRRARTLSKSRKRAVKARDGWRCVQCGANDPLEVDHIVGYADGGSDDMDNLRTLCRPCHAQRRSGKRGHE